MGKYDPYDRRQDHEQGNTGFVAVGETSNTADSIKAGLALAEPKVATARGQYAVIPEGATLESLEPLLGHLDRPARIRGAVTFTDAASFVTYVNRFKDAATLMLGDEKAGTLRAILDYHEAPAAPRWGDHAAAFTFRQTEAWKRWVGANGKRMNQTEFAAFLEDNLVDIAVPAGAVLLEMAKNFEVKKNAAFSSVVRLDNGEVQFKYLEDVQGTSRNGEMTVPTMFVLALAPYEGVEPYRVDGDTRNKGFELCAGPARKADNFGSRNLFSNHRDDSSSRRDAPFFELIGR